MEPVQLRAMDLIAEAERLVGADGGAKWRFLDGLEVLVDALNEEARLSSAGAKIVRDGLVGSLVTQLRVRELVESDDRVSGVDIRRPLFVTCLPRMGSTWLHNLLAGHSGLRAPLMWEVMAPYASALGPTERMAAADEATRSVREYLELAPAMSILHAMDGGGVEECHRLMAHTFRTRVLESRFHVPRYQKWLRTVDMRETYAYHQLLLRCILVREPRSRLVLKCVYHMWYLPILFATYPDARVITLHRDPVAALNSMCEMTEAARRGRSDYLDRVEHGRYWREFYTEGTGLAVKQADGADGVPAQSILHVRYKDLVSDTQAVIERICDFADLENSEKLLDSVRRNPLLASRAGGPPRPSLANYGIDKSDFDSSVADYRSRFQV